MYVLVACEESQAVCIEFRKLGHFAFSCDIQECTGQHPEYHIVNDVLPLLNGKCSFITQSGDYYNVPDKWDMIIAFPPCTYLSNAGNRSLYNKDGSVNQERFSKGMAAREFFMQILYSSSKSKGVCISNKSRDRSKTFPGIAAAMAAQWGNLC